MLILRQRLKSIRHHYKVFCTVFNFHISIGIDGANITCFKPTIVSKVFLIIRFK
jgi:hypothetical protein